MSTHADTDGAGLTDPGPEPLSPVARLVADVVSRLDDEGTAAVDDACRAHPELAEELRRRLDALEQVGLLGRGRLGPYALLRLLGRGGMGVVHLARDVRDGRLVALKALPGRMLPSDAARQRFRRETRAIAQLDHPCLVRLVEAGDDDGVPWYSMEWVDGRTLSELIDALRAMEVAAERLDAGHLAGLAGSRAEARGGAWVETVCRLVLDVAEALAHAHAHGVVHRDVKPSNVLVDERGRARLFDFGLALVDDASRVTLSGDFTGTPGYVAPEQVSGPASAVDARADVYALGVTMYELLTLRRPFEGATPAEVLRKVEHAEPVPPRRLNPAVGRDVETVCLTALEKAPADRYASADAMAADLRAVLELRPVSASGPRWPRRLRRWAARHVAATVALGLALLIVVGAPLGLMAANAGIRAQAERAQRLQTLAEMQAEEAESERARAVSGEARAEQEARRAELAAGRAELAAQRATQAQEFLYGLLRSPNPRFGVRDVRVRDVLDDAADRALDELSGQPLVLADVLISVGLTQYALGRLPEAELALERALAHIGAAPDGAELLAERLPRAWAGLMAVYADTGRLADADAAARRALELDERLTGADGRYVAEDLGGLAIVAAKRGDPGAIPLLRAALGLRRAALGDDAPDTAVTKLNLAVGLMREGADESACLLLEAIDTLRRDPDAPQGGAQLAMAYRSLAIGEVREGRREAAIEHLHAALGVGLVAWDDDHPELAATRVLLGLMLLGTPEQDDAGPMLRAALPTLRAMGPPGDSQRAMALERLSYMATTGGEHGLAVELLDELVGVRRRHDGPTARTTEQAVGALADAFERAGRPDQAREALAALLRDAEAPPADAAREALAARCREALAALASRAASEAPAER